jgi:hypothetical protein
MRRQIQSGARKNENHENVVGKKNINDGKS